MTQIKKVLDIEFYSINIRGLLFDIFSFLNKNSRIKYLGNQVWLSTQMSSSIFYCLKYVTKGRIWKNWALNWVDFATCKPDETICIAKFERSIIQSAGINQKFKHSKHMYLKFSSMAKNQRKRYWSLPCLVAVILNTMG